MLVALAAQLREVRSHTMPEHRLRESLEGVVDKVSHCKLVADLHFVISPWRRDRQADGSSGG